jgi:hypothetical protein
LIRARILLARKQVGGLIFIPSLMRRKREFGFDFVSVKESRKAENVLKSRMSSRSHVVKTRSVRDVFMSIR